MIADHDMLASSESITIAAKETDVGQTTGFLDDTRTVDEMRWDSIIDKLLEWLQASSASDPEEADPAIVKTAIDFAFDWRSQQHAPTCVGQTGDGGISFDWESSDLFETIEITGIGTAEYTRFDHGDVVLEVMLCRNPKTRLIELRD